jgi:hypothetical protein
MQIDILKKIIKEVVKETIREELSLLFENNTGLKSLQDNAKIIQKDTQKVIPRRSSIQDILEDTRKELSSQDFNNLIGNPGVVNESIGYANFGENITNSNQVGLDISNLDFISKATEIFKKTKEI